MSGSAAIYDYTPTQARVVQLYDHYRTALMNAKYYARRIAWLKRAALVTDGLTAVAASSAFAGFAIWKTDVGRIVLGVLLGIATVLSILRPILRIPDKIDRCSKLHYGYLEIYYRIESLLNDMRLADRVTPEHSIKASGITDRFMALELEGDAYQNPKQLLKYQDEVERSLPSEGFWLPSE